MGAAANIRAGKAYAELGVKDKTEAALQRFKKRVMAAGQAVRQVGLGMVALGSVGVAKLGIAATTFAKMGGDMLELSQRTGISVQALTELDYALSQSNSDIGALETGIKGMQKALEGVNEDGEETKDIFSQLALSVSELKSMSPDMQFEKIADAISQLPSASERTAAALKVFGKAGTGLLPAMLDGAKGIKELRDQAIAMGVTFDDDAARSADALGDSVETLWRQVKALVFEVGSALAPALTAAAVALSSALAGVIEFVKNNKSLVLVVGGISVGLIAAGALLVGIGTTASLAGIAIGGLATAWAAMGAIAAGSLAVITSPITITVGAIAALSAGVLQLTVGFGKMWEGAKSAFSQIAGLARTTFGGIADSLASGDIERAGRILQAGLEVLWLEITRQLAGIWDSFITGVAIGLLSVTGTLDAAMIDAMVANDMAADAARADKVNEAYDILNALIAANEADLAKQKSAAQSRIGSAAAGAAAIANSAASTGTFNSRAVQSLSGSDGLWRRTAAATEATAKHTKRMVDALGSSMRFQ